MFKRLFFAILSIMFWQAAFAALPDKGQYDVILPVGEHSLQKSSGFGLKGEMLSGEILSASLIQGGYFTLGTNQGKSPGQLDDNCNITFGHPYALTSYPLIALDGAWMSLESACNIRSSHPIVEGDSLSLSYTIAGIIQYRFCLRFNPTGDAVIIRSVIRNTDSLSHQLGAGLIFDPALGKHGDGRVIINEQPITNTTTMLTSIPEYFDLVERTGDVPGIRLRLNCDTPPKPESVELTNWLQLIAGDDEGLASIKQLFDLVMVIRWPVQTVGAGETLAQSCSIALQEPDFGTSVFLRCDMPSFLTLENNLLFPRSFITTAEIYNATSTSMNALTLQIESPGALSTPRESIPFPVQANQVRYLSLPFDASELLKPLVAEVKLEIYKQSTLEDYLIRPVYIPAIPLADTGLVCTIDTVDASRFPDVRFIFRAEIEKTGQPLLNLNAENITVFEDEQLIDQFTMQKDTTGGLHKADVVFVLDCSGSMGDDIENVRRNIGEFADSLRAKGIDLRVGVVAFSTTVDDVHDLTDNIELFKQWLAAIDLWGGRENSLAALWRATELSLRPDARHTFVWITDEDYPVAPEINLTVQDVVNRLLQYEVTVHAIGLPGLQTQWSNPIIEPTGGQFFDINGNFRDILLTIGDMRTSDKYFISYRSPSTGSGTHQIMLELHYAGRGGFGYASYDIPGLVESIRPALQFYPNPFNPSIQFVINLNPGTKGELDIFNVIGQRVRSFELPAHISRHVVHWNASDESDRNVAAGTYFVRLKTIDAAGRYHIAGTRKILYLK